MRYSETLTHLTNPLNCHSFASFLDLPSTNSNPGSMKCTDA